MTLPPVLATLASIGTQVVSARAEQRRRVNAAIARNDLLERKTREVARLRRENATLEARYALLVVRVGELEALLDRRDGFEPRAVA